MSNFKKGIKQASEVQEAAEFAFALYLQARNSNALDVMLLGGESLRKSYKDVDLHENFLSTFVIPALTVNKSERDQFKREVPKASQDHASQAAKLVHDGKGTVGRGAILNEKHWWSYVTTIPNGIIINDAWLLGGIAVRKKFYLTVSPFWPDAVWDAAKKRPTVFGREILGLIHFGYKLIIMVSSPSVDTAKVEDYYLSPPINIAVSADPLTLYGKSVSSITTVDLMLEAIYHVAHFEIFSPRGANGPAELDRKSLIDICSRKR